MTTSGAVSKGPPVWPETPRAAPKVIGCDQRRLKHERVQRQTRGSEQDDSIAGKLNVVLQRLLVVRGELRVVEVKRDTKPVSWD